MKIETFIFVHDQNIILDCIKYGKYKSLNNVKYVFVGDRETDKIENIDNVIISKNLKYNIEEYPKLTSYTGWYSLWKNNLITGDYLNLFEYDIELTDEFNKLKEVLEGMTPNIIGYIPLNVHSIVYLKTPRYCKELIEGINDVYGIDTIKRINELNKDSTCSVTSNHTFKKEIFVKYMEWVEPLLEYIKENNYSGHQIERSISLFYILNYINKVKIMSNALKHFQLDTHETQNIPKQKFNDYYNKVVGK